MEHKFSEELKNLLKESYFAYLCTVDGHNMSHVTPVFFVYNEELNLIYFMSTLKSRKITNILSNNKVSLTVDIRDPVNPFNNRGMMIEGEARLEAEIKLMESPSNRVFLKKSAVNAFKMFEVKYPVLKETDSSAINLRRMMNKYTEVLISVKPKKMIYWSGGPKFKRIEFQ